MTQSSGAAQPSLDALTSLTLDGIIGERARDVAGLTVVGDAQLESLSMDLERLDAPLPPVKQELGDAWLIRLAIRDGGRHHHIDLLFTHSLRTSNVVWVHRESGLVRTANSLYRAKIRTDAPPTEVCWRIAGGLNEIGVGPALGVPPIYF